MEKARWWGNEDGEGKIGAIKHVKCVNCIPIKASIVQKKYKNILNKKGNIKKLYQRRVYVSNLVKHLQKHKKTIDGMQILINKKLAFRLSCDYNKVHRSNLCSHLQNAILECCFITNNGEK